MSGRRRVRAAAALAFAWVLWESSGASVELRWSVVDGFESLQECRESRGRYAQERGYSPTTLPYTFLSPAGGYVQLSCLPGTVGNPNPEARPGR